MKRDHEQQESTKRKVLKLDEGQDEFSSGSDTEKTGRGKKDKKRSGSNVDIQVNSVEKVFSYIMIGTCCCLHLLLKYCPVCLRWIHLCWTLLCKTGGEVQAAPQHVRAAGCGQRQSGLILPTAGFAEAPALQRPLPSNGTARRAQHLPQRLWPGRPFCSSHSDWYSKPTYDEWMLFLFKWSRCFIQRTSREWWSIQPVCLPLTQRCY